ncbi:MULTISPECIES: alpha/beta fold hydrolase [Chloracidobacterium]|uniref:Alpha/beta hydrolase n=2 Tax=Chloracidobacterium TaxID=458032 RepID=A0ABX8AYK9_9BACT|nr:MULTISPECIES: alpha/beta hydrolase [Chloracidobacterium]AEP12894.1 putative hydrolases or acyltransferases (alpha/beta hydrolase superfamily) [Chloracidobacterium thermophilum B]QUV78614.1 alpha/beta hydrolase [Chloracidobacterium thermophilum]QUV83847.1 alpha/beta hydrolase [Chloracidobacterium sp. 2]QUV87672.1 alpha/beta hydrolase [Chloracidobacterium sp. S]QUV90571.1 alpha/beta hydrolase [Chloracidobacterium sp. A]
MTTQPEFVFATEKFCRHLDELAARERRETAPLQLAVLATMREFASRARFIRLGGIRHHAYEYGPVDGPAVMLLHGWDCSSYWFYRLAPALGQHGFRVIAFDFRGHGFSDADPQDDYTLPTLAQDTLRLADLLGIQRFHLVSFSLGSAVALLVGRLAPERVGRQVVMNFGLFDYSALRAQLLPPILKTIFDTLRRIPSKTLVYRYVSLTLAQREVTWCDVEMGFTSLVYCHSQAAFLAVTDLVRQERVAQVQQATGQAHPTLVITGEFDPVVPFADSLRLAQTIPVARLHILLRTGHLVLFERPDDIERLTAEWLAAD